MLNLAGYIPESIVDGEGVRAVLFFSGCKWNCPGCHNLNIQSFDYGTQFSKSIQNEIIEDILNNPLLDGITLSGGDIFFSSEEVSEFVKELKKKDNKINIWAYTGFTWENLTKNTKSFNYQLLQEIDVLVDGLFVLEQRDTTLKFKGSGNQRIIDVKQSLNHEKIILKN